MAITAEGNAVPTGLWPQGDARDPLGVWGFRVGVTGDASGGSVKVGCLEAADRKSAYVYTCYSAIAVGLVGAFTDDAVKCRLLTNWPDVDPIAGQQGYATAISQLLNFNSNFTPPVYVPNIQPLVSPNERFILLFDPRPTSALSTLVEMEIAQNLNGGTYSFEAYGYYWDRSVMDTPGGPRHPGSN